MLVAGVDLSVRRPSAIAVLDGCELAYFGLARGDDEILHAVSLLRPSVVAIDAPLSYPPEGRALRDVELELARLGYRLLPPLMGAMRELAARGIRLSRRLQCEVIEVHPTTSLKAMGISREELGRAVGLSSRDLLDAYAAALTAVAYVKGLYRRLGPFVLPAARVCV
jgi:predicted nuclease with RNAse H fold